MAKLPCVPESRMFTLKDTGETMSYDQVRQYLMENPDIWLGAKEGKEVANALKDVESTAKALDDAIKSSGIEFVEEDGKVRMAGGGIESKVAAQRGDKKENVTEPSLIPFLPKIINALHLARSSKDKSSILKNGFDEKQASIDSPIPGIYFSSEDWSTMDRFGRAKENGLYVSVKNDGLIYFDDSNSFRNYLKENKLPYEGQTLTQSQLNQLKAKGVKGILLREDFASQSRNELIVIDKSIIENISDKEKSITPFPSSFSDPKSISEAYHKAKKDGTNPELVKAVEELLGGKEVAMPKAEVQVEQYKPITKKNIEIGKFSKDEALDYEEDEKELDSGRMSTYISSMTVDVMDENGNSIGNLIRLKDEDGIATYQATDIDGNELTLDEFDTKDEAIQALLDAHNKQAEKEFNKEQKRLAKEREKQAAKKQPSPEQELKAAFNKWREETGKMGIAPNWEKQAEADIKLFKALAEYVKKKLAQGAFSFEQFIKDLGKTNVENIDKDKERWRKFYNDAVAETEKKEAPKAPPVTPSTPPRAEPQGEGEREIRERKTITSIKEATDISDAVKDALGGERTKYEVLPNWLSVQEASAILNSIGEAQAKELVLTSNTNMPSAFRATLAQVLIKQYNKEKRYKDAVDVAEGVAEAATDWGQGIQALSLLEFLTPEGQLIAAQREINRQKEKKFEAHKSRMDKMKKALKKADEEAVDAAVESVVTQTEETPAPKATRKKEYGESNKIVTKSLYDAAKKALKSIKLFTTPIPEELITIAAYHIEAGARSFADFSKEMVKDFGRKVRPYLKSAYKKAQAKVGGTGYSTDAEIAKHLSTDIEKDIREIIKESGIKIREVIKQHYSEGNRKKEDITKALVDKLGLDESDAATIAAKVETEFNRIATEKKKQALKALEGRLERKTPVRKTAEQKLIELSNMGALDEKAFKEEYARAMGFPELTAENAAKITELAEKVQQAAEGRPKQKAIVDLLNYQANLKGTDLLDVGTAVWMASILSGPITQVKNIFGNTFNMSALVFDVAITNPKEIRFLLKGLTVGLGNGLAEGGTTLVTGYPPMKLRNEAMGILERADFGKYNPLFTPYKSLKYVTRFMMAADALTYGGLREMRAYQKALADAKESYPSVNAVQKAIEILGQTDEQMKVARETAQAEYNAEIASIESDTTLSKKQRVAKKAAAALEKQRRIYDIIEQSRPEYLVADSHNFALKGTFNNPPEGALGVGARFVNGMVHNIPVLRFAIPFTNVISNVANNTINYTPLGYIRAARGGSITMGKLKTVTDEDRARMVRSATLGVTAAVAAYVLSAIGGDDEDEEKNWFSITAEGYGDYKKNKELEATGWRPYSIKVGKTWMSYQLTPLMGILSGVGAIRDYEKYHKKKMGESDFNKLVMPFQVMTSTIAESSYLSSVEGFLSAILDASRGDMGQKTIDWATKWSSAYVPVIGTNFYQQNAQMIQRLLDIPDKEYRGTYFGKMLRTVPYARDQYFNTVNGLGEELPPAKLNIIYSKSDGGKYAKLWQLMADKNQVTSKPERRGASYIDINGDEKAMTDEQFYLFAKTRGEHIRDLMYVNYDKLKDMDDKEFADWLKSVKTSANKYASEELVLKESGGIYEKSIQKYKGEAEHEKSKILYSIDLGDAEETKQAFENYESLSPKTTSENKDEVFEKIVSDEVMPTGVKTEDKIDFYRGVFSGYNPKIGVQQRGGDGKVKVIYKPFREVFSQEEIDNFRAKYVEQEKIVAKKLEVLDRAIQTRYSTRKDGSAVWRRYVKPSE